MYKHKNTEFCHKNQKSKHNPRGFFLFKIRVFFFFLISFFSFFSGFFEKSPKLKLYKFRVQTLISIIVIFIFIFILVNSFEIFILNVYVINLINYVNLKKYLVDK